MGQGQESRELFSNTSTNPGNELEAFPPQMA